MSKNTAAKVETVANTETTETAKVEQVAVDVKALLETMETKSAVIRHLASTGMKTGDINKAFETAGIKMRYQHVRNVLITPVKKSA